MSWWIGEARGSSEIVLHAEVSGLRLFQDGVTEFACKEHEGPLAFHGDSLHEFLDHDAGTAAELIQERLGGCGIVLRYELRAVGGGRNARLDDGFVPAELVEFFFQGYGTALVWPGCGNNRDASGVEVAQVGFVGVPAKKRSGIEDRDVCRLELSDSGKEFFGLKMVIPTGTNHDCSEAGPVLIGIVPNRGVGFDSVVR